MVKPKLTIRPKKVIVNYSFFGNDDFHEETHTDALVKLYEDGWHISKNGCGYESKYWKTKSLTLEFYK